MTHNNNEPVECNWRFPMAKGSRKNNFTFYPRRAIRGSVYTMAGMARASKADAWPAIASGATLTSREALWTIMRLPVTAPTAKTAGSSGRRPSSTGMKPPCLRTDQGGLSGERCFQSLINRTVFHHWVAKMQHSHFSPGSVYPVLASPAPGNEVPFFCHRRHMFCC